MKGVFMNTVPDMISSKDLAYISDMFNWNYTIAKKAQFYTEFIEDKEILSEIKKTYSLHKQICESLLKILKDGKYEQGE